jgi:hypothetical protein
VPRDDPGASPEESTGVHPATRAFTRWVGWVSTFRTLGTVVLAIAVGTILGWERIGAMAETRGAAKAAELEPRLTAVEQFRVEVYDLRKELRSFYDWQRTGQPMVLLPLTRPPEPGAKDGGR